VGVVSTSKFYRTTIKLQTCDNPQPRKLGSPLRGGTRGFILIIHIHVALQAAVVELAFFGGLSAEVMLEFRFGGNDILFPSVGEFQVAAKGLVQTLALRCSSIRSP